MYHQGSPFPWRQMFFGISALLAWFERKGHFFEVFCLLFETFESIPRNIYLRRTVPSCFSSCGFLSLELFLWGQQCHHAFRVRDSHPTNYSRLGQQCRLAFRVMDSDPSNYFPRAISAILLFELCISIPRIYTFRPAAPLVYLNIGSWFCGLFHLRLWHIPVQWTT
jgi:hypothetical protein